MVIGGASDSKDDMAVDERSEICTKNFDIGETLNGECVNVKTQGLRRFSDFKIIYLSLFKSFRNIWWEKQLN